MRRIFVSSIIKAPTEAVWHTVRDFNGMPGWHPAIRDSEIEDGRAADSIGCVRSMHMTDGGHIREQLLALSEIDRSMTYRILESPMPITDYVATLRVVPVTDDGYSFCEWHAEFEVAADQESETVDTVVNDVFQAGFDALKQRLG
ncbi:SRPBCC family protein [Salinisphaera sp.]|uniref:SRPBCC family protein n=1 Tax=Salinisphaera sp. TaxID=1914330 RepID=UPI002D77F1E1|nr:SRPBCC family protein [Salinisphaera sp.]HET7315566.1 SRPBCC family protein [Salinisphaera sp.]